MSNQTELIETPTGNGQESPTGIMASPISIVDRTNVLEKARGLKKAKVVATLGFKYKSFSNQGDKVRGVFLGGTKLTKNTPNGQEEIPAVVWVEEDEQTYCNGGVSLVGAFVKNGITAGTMFEAEFTGKAKTGNGNSVNEFTIRILG